MNSGRGAGRDARAAAAAAYRERALGLLPELAGQQVPRRRIHHWLASLVAGVIALTLVAAVFAGFWGYQWWQSQVGTRQSVSATQISGANTATFASSAKIAAAAPAGTGAAPVVLTYHDIRPDSGGSEYVVSPGQFAAQMKMLQEAGYRSLTAEDFLRYHRGGTVPPRSVLITFDDGTRGLWTYADKVLARYGFTAVSFLISGRVGKHAPYYLTWSEVSRMASSGRWDFESHTHDLHTKVALPGGQPVSSLSSRLTENGRRESLATLRARVAADLKQSLRDFAAHDLPRPRLFAWPFSDVTGNPNDPAAATAASEVVHRIFQLAFVDAYQPSPATRSEVRDGTVQRLEVYGADTVRSMFDKMQEMSTLPVQRLSPTQQDQSWLEHGGHPAPMDGPSLAEGVVTPDALTLTYLAAYWAPQRTSEWTEYRLTGTVVPPKGGGTLGMLVRGEGNEQVAVRMSANVVSVTAGGKIVASRTFSDYVSASAGRHSVDVAVTATSTRVVVDGLQLVEPPVRTGEAARGGIGVVFSRASPANAWGNVRDLRVRPLK